jgi:hypothetical protein
MTLSIDIQHNRIECHYAECHYAECGDYLNVMLSVVMLNAVMLSVVRLNVVMLSVVAPSTRNNRAFVFQMNAGTLCCWRHETLHDDIQRNDTQQ